MKLVRPRHPLRDFAIAVTGVLVGSFWTTRAFDVGSAAHIFVRDMALIAGGPITGWVLAVQHHALPGALVLLLPTTGIGGVLMALYLWIPGWFPGLAFIALAIAWWLTCGFLYSLGVWI